MLRTRTLIGIICIVLSFLLFFGLLPFLVSFEKKEVRIVTAAVRIPRGTPITEDMLNVVMLASEVPGALGGKEEIVGKYAAVDLPAGDIFLADKLAAGGSGTAEVLGSLKEGEYALTVQVSSFSGAFSGQLTNGDIVKIYVTGANGTYAPEELNYVQVISTVTSDGVTRDLAASNGQGESKQAASVMFKVCDRQALTLFSLGAKSSYHCAFICHGSDPRAEELLRRQSEIIESAEKAARQAAEGEAQ